MIRRVECGVAAVQVVTSAMDEVADPVKPAMIVRASSKFWLLLARSLNARNSSHRHKSTDG